MEKNMDRKELEKTIQKWKGQPDPEARKRDFNFSNGEKTEQLEIKIDNEVVRNFDFSIDSNGIIVFEDLQFSRDACVMSSKKIMKLLDDL
jgi:hypothetical protein